MLDHFVDAEDRAVFADARIILFSGCGVFGVADAAFAGSDAAGHMLFE